MNISTINFDSFQKLKDEDCQERIIKAKKILGQDLLILGHHYQNEAVYRHADFAGDSLKLAQHVQKVEAKYIVFLATIATLYRKMSFHRSVCWSVGRSFGPSVTNAFQS